MLCGNVICNLLYRVWNFQVSFCIGRISKLEIVSRQDNPSWSIPLCSRSSSHEFFTSPQLRSCLYGGRDARLPGRGVFYPGFKNCLYGRRDGMFTGTGRFSSRVYMRMFLPGTISPKTICKVSIISSRQSGTECLYDKNCPAFPGIPVERTGIPLCRDGTKNVPAKFFPYKRNGTNNRYIHAWRDPV